MSKSSIVLKKGRPVPAQAIDEWRHLSEITVKKEKGPLIHCAIVQKDEECLPLRAWFFITIKGSTEITQTYITILPDKSWCVPQHSEETDIDSAEHITLIFKY